MEEAGEEGVLGGAVAVEVNVEEVGVTGAAGEACEDLGSKVKSSASA